MRDALIFVFKRPGRVRREYSFQVHLTGATCPFTARVGYPTPYLLVEAIDEYLLDRQPTIRLRSIQLSRALLAVPGRTYLLSTDEFNEVFRGLLNASQGIFEITHKDVAT